MTVVRTDTSLWALPRIRAIFTINLAGFTSFFLTLGALPAWAARNAQPESVAGTVTGAMLAATVLTQLSSAALMRRFSMRRLIVVGLVLMGAPTPFYLWATGLWSLYGLSVVRGVGFAILTVVGAVAIPQAGPGHRQGEAIGIYGLAAAIPNMLAVSAGAALTLGGRFAVVAWLAAVPLLAFPAARALPGSRPERAAGTGAHLSLPTVTRRLLLPSMVLFLVTFSGGGLVTIVPLQRPSAMIAAAALLAFGATGTAARWRVGNLTDRIGHQAILPKLVALGIVGLALTAGGLADDSGPTAALLLLGAAVFGISFGALQSVTLDLSLSAVPGPDAPTASAVWNAAFDGGTAAGAAVIGYFAGTTLGGTWALSIGAFGLATVGLVLLLTRRTR